MKSSENILTHLEAIRTLLWRVLVVIFVLLFPAFYFSSDLLNFIVEYSFPIGVKLNYFSPFEPLMIQLKVSFIAALVVSLPYAVFEIVKFISPALHKNEKKWAFGLIISSILLAITGISFSFFIILPMIMEFSLSLATKELEPVIGIKNFLDMATWMIVGFAVTFQLPLVILTAVKLGFVSCAMLSKSRPLIVGAILLLAALLTPPDIISQVMLALPCWILFEISLIFAKKIEECRIVEEVEDENIEPFYDNSNLEEKIYDNEKYYEHDQEIEIFHRIRHLRQCRKNKKVRFIGNSKRKRD